MVEVKLWGALHPATGGASTIEIEATTIRELLRKLQEQYPDTAPFVKNGIAVSIDGVLYRDSWEKKLPPSAEIYLLPRIVGG